MQSAKAFRKKLGRTGSFYTPKPIAKYLRSLFPADVGEVYDPTCGNGALLAEFPEAEKFGQEIDETGAAEAMKIPKTHIEIGDTLKDDRFAGKKFRYIVGNPPFSVNWEPAEDERFAGFPLAPRSKADFAFVLHCLAHLTDDGLCVLLLFPGTLYRGNSEGKIRRELVEQGWVKSVAAIGGKAFEDTSIETVCVTFGKTPGESIMFADTTTGKSREVPIDEIAENGFCLSPTIYLPADEKKEVVDPLQLQRDLRSAELRRLERLIDCDGLVCELEGYKGDLFSPTKFMDEIESIVRRKRKDFAAKMAAKADRTLDLFGWTRLR